jgi:hypothetical protein
MAKDRLVPLRISIHANRSTIMQFIDDNHILRKVVKRLFPVSRYACVASCLNMYAEGLAENKAAADLPGISIFLYF